jgi:hypothetical protein
MIVLGKRFAEEMAAFGIGDEIQVVRFGRTERGPERRTSRIGYGTWRKADMAIRIVRRIKGEASRIQAAAIISGQFEGVNDSWIALQRYAVMQAINENTGDDGPLFRPGGFAFDEGCKRHNFFERQA